MEPVEVTYKGPAGLAGRFVSYLEAEGAEVDWEPPLEERGTSEMAQAILVTLAVQGTNAAIRAAAAKFRERWPGPDVNWREDDAYR